MSLPSLPSLLRSPAPAFGLAGLLGVADLSHFAIPGFYDAIVPHTIPGSARAWTLASGAVELACAAAVALPRTRRLGATMAAVLFVAVFPANIQMAVDWRSRPAFDQAIAYGRLPLQVPLVLWALAVRRASLHPAPRAPHPAP
jgi:uncharacterized membrane protein